MKKNKVIPTAGGRTPEEQKAFDLEMLKTYDVDYMAQKMYEYDIKNGAIHQITEDIGYGLEDYVDVEYMKKLNIMSYYTDEAKIIHDENEPHDILCILEQFMLGLADINEMCGQAVRVPQHMPMPEIMTENERIQAELTALMNQ